MKKIIILILVFFVIAGCQKKEQPPEEITLNTQLADAIAEDNVALAKNLLNQGAYANESEERKKILLTLANSDEMRFVISNELGIEKNAYDKNAQTTPVVQERKSIDKMLEELAQERQENYTEEFDE